MRFYLYNWYGKERSTSPERQNMGWLVWPLCVATLVGCEVYDDSLLLDAPAQGRRPVVSEPGENEVADETSGGVGSFVSPEPNSVQGGDVSGQGAALGSQVSNGNLEPGPTNESDDEVPLAAAPAANPSPPEDDATQSEAATQPQPTNVPGDMTPSEDPGAIGVDEPSEPPPDEPEEVDAEDPSTADPTADDTADDAGNEDDPAPVPNNAAWSFDTDQEGWLVGISDPAPLRPLAVLSFTDLEGASAPGALMLEMPFSKDRERLFVQVPLEPTDLSGRILTAKVKITRGMSSDPMFPSTIKLFAKSGSGYLFAAGMPVPVMAGGEWINITFDLAWPEYVDPVGAFDAADVREIGFELNTGYSATAVTAAVIYFDDVTY